MRTTWQSQFDSAWLPVNADLNMVQSGRTENCIKSPRQIKRKVLVVNRAARQTTLEDLAKIRVARVDKEIECEEENQTEPAEKVKREHYYEEGQHFKPVGKLLDSFFMIFKFESSAANAF